MHAISHPRPVRGYELAEAFPDLLAPLGISPLGVNGRHLFLGRNMALARDCIALTPNQLRRQGILVLTFFQVEQLCHLFPRRNAAGQIVGWDHNEAASAIIHLCGKRGVINPRDFGFTPSPAGRWQWKGDAQ